MKYYAHIDGERKQSVKEHLYGTAELAGNFAESFGKREWGYCCGMLHDIGKYSDAFQDRIQNKSNRMVDHATAGAKVCLDQGRYYSFLSYCIAGHHAGLPDYGNTSDSGSAGSLMGRSKKEIQDYTAYKKEIQIPQISTAPFDSKRSSDPDFSLSFFIRMLYSCLVDADFLDTEYFMKNGNVERDPGETSEILLKKLEKYIAGWLSNEQTDTVNGRRTEILNTVLHAGN